MIVDPFTGLPVEMSGQPTANTMAGQMGQDALLSTGMDPNAGMMGALSHMPAAYTSMGWNARRGGNTILRGGWSRNAENKGKFLRNHFSPRSFGRMSSIHNVDPTSLGETIGHRFGRSGKRKMYSPFNALASLGNMGAPEGSPRFSPGMMSRINAAGMIEKGDGRFRKLSGERILDNVSSLDPGLGKAMNNLGRENFINTRSMHGATLVSSQGEYTQKLGGYIHGSKYGALADTDRELWEQGGKKFGIEGAEAAAKHLAFGGVTKNTAGKMAYTAADGTVEYGYKAFKSGFKHAMGSEADKIAVKAGTKAAEEIGLKAAGKFTGAAVAQFIPGVNVAVDALLTTQMIFDIGMMGSSAVVGAANTAKDAVRSFKGSIAKPVMGMGYKDNTVAATSRSRGVLAIQNSQLNARSVFGSEAVGMAAHFG